MKFLISTTYSFLDLLFTVENGLRASQSNMVRVPAIFSECRVIMILGLIVVVFIIVLFVMVVFVIVHYCNMHNIAPHGATTAEPLISSSAVVQEGSPED